MRERTSERRRPSTLPGRLAWGRALRGAGLLGLAALSAAAVVRLAALLEGSELLPIKAVTVHGADGARVDEVLAYAAVPVGAPLLGVETSAVAERVAQHPFVARAAVRRVPPDAIVIDVELRAPVAALAAGELYLVDKDGHVMKSARAGDGLDLPVITGIDAADLAGGAGPELLRGALLRLDAHTRAGEPGGELAEIAVLRGAGYELVLEDGLRVRVGDDASESQFVDKLGRLDAVLRRLAAAGVRASFIHLDDDRRPERAAVRLRSAAETPPIGG
ncbi:MAG: hypothetical protein A2138_06500 [Deltaproteobacteria bacterium RBG_16_71_12]|nr:MAG: hypothetical protein A2138_06500 [Deltaproteobacteria bacterium RBG_16_71_12]